jgi:RNA polymerase sigma-70 factor (ECF subfamily)
MPMDPSRQVAVSPGDEAALVAALRRGDGAAYERLVQDNAGRLLAVARRYLESDDDAQDAVQETFLSAFKALGGFSGDARISTWLHRIVVNTALMKLRRRGPRSEQSIDPLLPTFLPDGHNAHPAALWDESVVDAVEREEIRAWVRACIERLPETHRVVLMLRDIDEVESDEAARMLGVSPNALKTRLHRARQALRTLLDEKFRGFHP